MSGAPFNAFTNRKDKATKKNNLRTVMIEKKSGNLSFTKVSWKQWVSHLLAKFKRRKPALSPVTSTSPQFLPALNELGGVLLGTEKQEGKQGEALKAKCQLLQEKLDETSTVEQVLASPSPVVITKIDILPQEKHLTVSSSIAPLPSLFVTLPLSLEEVSSNRLDSILPEVKGERSFKQGKAYYTRGDYAQALAHFQKAAEQKHVTAYVRLAELYLEGQGTAKDKKTAVAWYRKAADQGDAEAQSMLGFCYAIGAGIQKDLKAAVFWCRKAADQGHMEAQYGMGMCYEQGAGVKKNPKVAIEWYRKAVQQGDTKAAYRLSICCAHEEVKIEKDLKIERDLKETASRYRTAANQGYVRAQFNLGVCYEQGMGVEKNPKVAVDWYRRAVQQGDTKARCRLGICYEEGIGVEKDLNAAVFWYRKAAKHGDAEACYRLGACTKNIGIKKSEKAAVFWRRKAAEEYRTAYSEKRQNRKKEEQKTVRWHQKMADQSQAHCSLSSPPPAFFTRLETSLPPSVTSESNLPASISVLPNEATQATSAELERKRQISSFKTQKVQEISVTALLQCVVKGQQSRAEALLKSKPGLALMKGTVTDLAKREFKHITAFQYALWALDWHMWQMILQYLPKEEAALQFAELEKKRTVHGKHFSLKRLIDALETYINHYGDPEWFMTARRKQHWCKVVGGCQLHLPAHVINEYCYPQRPFDPCPSFTEVSLPRCMNFWDGRPWFRGSDNGGTLGVRFAVVCSDRGARPSTWERPLRYFPEAKDVIALKKLWKTRLLQLKSLEIELVPKKISLLSKYCGGNAFFSKSRSSHREESAASNNALRQQATASGDAPTMRPIPKTPLAIDCPLLGATASSSSSTLSPFNFQTKTESEIQMRLRWTGY